MEYDSVLTLWIYCNASLYETTEKIVQTLNLGEFHWDMENVWEWSTNDEDDVELKYNFSRSHRDGEGEYDKPLVMKFEKRTGGFGRDEIDQIALRIQKRLDTTVYRGIQIYTGSNDFEYRVTDEYKKE